MKKLVIGTIIATLIACLIEFILWFVSTYFITWCVCALLGIAFLGAKRVLAIALVIMIFKAILKGDD